MKGIVLAGGRATRLHPITITTCKQLLPVYDKPMVYYPISTLMSAGIREILIISSPDALPHFKTLLGDGSALGVSFSYQVQEEPRGLADAFVVGEEFIGDDSVALILGDNIFYGGDLSSRLKAAAVQKKGATVFAYHVSDPERYGVLSFDEHNVPIDIIEKPKEAPSHWAVTGLYFYDNAVVDIAKKLKPSARGEIEITDVNKAYFNKKEISVELFDRGYAWLDTGMFNSLLDAANFIKTLEDRQGLKVGCIEEEAYLQGFISKEQLLKLAAQYQTAYGSYLRSVAEGDNYAV